MSRNPILVDVRPAITFGAGIATRPAIAAGPDRSTDQLRATQFVSGA